MPDYGYMGGGFYVPTPYSPPKVVKKTGGFNKNVKKNTSSGSAKRSPSRTIEKKATPKYTPIHHAVESVRKKYAAPRKATAFTGEAAPVHKEARRTFTGEAAPIHKEAPAPYAATAVAKTSAPAVTAYGIGGVSNGAISGGGVADTSTGTGASAEGTTGKDLSQPAAPTTQDIVVPSALSDATYILQLGALDKARARALTARDNAKSDYAVNFGNTLHNLGYDQTNNRWLANDNNSQYGQSFRGNMEDYGNRGMLYSTGYAEDLANMNQQYNNQYDQLNTAKTQYNTNQDNTYTDYLDQASDQQTAALQEATARIASKYGVDPTKVNTKDKNSTTVTIPVTS